MSAVILAPGVVSPFDGMDVPWLLQLQAKARRDHPFLIWTPFDAPPRIWSYGEFHERTGALAAGLAARGIRPGDSVLIHLDNCIEMLLAWFACVELGAIAVTTNTRSAAARRLNTSPAIAAQPPPSPSRLMPNWSPPTAAISNGLR